MNCLECRALCCLKTGRFNVARWDKSGVVRDRGDGICVHLDTDTLLCRIYETRPTMCRVDAAARWFFPAWLVRWLQTCFCRWLQWEAKP